MLNQIWRIKTKEELDKLIKHKHVFNYIKAQGLSWLGHVQRMPDTRTVKKNFFLLLHRACCQVTQLLHQPLHIYKIYTLKH